MLPMSTTETPTRRKALRLQRGLELAPVGLRLPVELASELRASVEDGKARTLTERMVNLIQLGLRAEEAEATAMSA